MRFYVPLIAAALLSTDVYAGKRKREFAVEDCDKPICVQTKYNPLDCENNTIERVNFFLPDHDDNLYYKIGWYQEVSDEDNEKGMTGTNGGTVVNDPPRKKTVDFPNVNGYHPFVVWAALYRDTSDEPFYTDELVIEACKNPVK